MATRFLTAANMKMPVVGLGTSTSAVELETTIELALEAGYRHIDTAAVYHNEQFVGNAVKKCIDGGKVKREDLFIVTKLAPTHLRPEHIDQCLKGSLEKLQLSYVDLYLIHNPVGLLYSETPPQRGPGGKPGGGPGSGPPPLDYSTDLVACWKSMELLVDAGLAKSIGVSNFNVSQLQRILKICRIKPANLQVEFHVHFQQPDLVGFCQDNGITLTAYGPLGSAGRPAHMRGQEDNSPPLPRLMEDPVVVEIAKHHKKTPSQILLKHLLQLGIAVIPKSSNPERLKANIDLFDFELTDEEFKQLKALDRGAEGSLFQAGRKFKSSHPEFPY